VAEVDAGGVAAVLAADADLDGVVGLASELDAHLDESADALGVEALEGVVGQDLLVDVVGRKVLMSSRE
jgi:hypothetical protein